MLSGDIHSAWANDLKADFADPASPTVASEFVTTSITADNQFGAALGQLRRFNPHIKFFDHLHGYALVTLTPDRWETAYRTIADVTVEDGTPETKATLATEAGIAGVVPA